jgi:uncharacterized protein YbjT (DUF2867 family)
MMPSWRICGLGIAATNGARSMKTVLVMGVRGKTGRQLAAVLARDPKIAVCGAGRQASGPGLPGIEARPFDWDDSSSWPAAVAGVNALYLIKPKTKDPAATVEALLRQARSLERVVLLSEIDADHRDDTTDERRVEQVIKALPLEWTILRPNWFMQNFAEPGFYLEAIRDAGEIKVPTGGQRTSFVDTRDIAEVAAAALLKGGHAGQSYTLTGPQALTWSDAMAQIGHAAGHDVRHVDPPFRRHLDALAEKGTPASAIDYYQRIFGSIQKGRTSVLSTDVEQVTGRQPRSFAAFVAENRRAWQRSGRT